MRIAPGTRQNLMGRRPKIFTYRIWSLDVNQPLDTWRCYSEVMQINYDFANDPDQRNFGSKKYEVEGNKQRQKAVLGGRKGYLG